MKTIKFRTTEKNAKLLSILAKRAGMSRSKYLHLIVSKSIGLNKEKYEQPRKGYSSYSISAKLTRHEKDAFYKKCQQERLTANAVLLMFVRTYVNQTPDFLKSEISHLVQLRAQITAIGNNLNQIARHLNSGGTVDQNLLKEVHHALNAYELLNTCLKQIIIKAKSRGVDD